jgi:CheY-like chemotaxis protein
MPHTLLLADDSVTIQRVIQLTFADEDIAVVAVNDGNEAIASLAVSHPDIVLASCDMRGKSGYEVARHIKSTPALAHVPVLLLAGAFESIDPERVAATGCDGVLTKPFEPQAVVRRVRELLDREGAIETGRPAIAVDGEVMSEPQPIFGDVVVADAGTDGIGEPALDNPAEMSASLPSPPPAVEPVLSEAVDHGFDAAEPLVADAAQRTPPAQGGQLDAYFDQLDRAIAARVSEQASRPAPPVAPPAPERSAAPERAPAVDRPVLADAFSALLAAEESETADPVTAMQSLLPRAEAVSGPPPAIVVSEEVVEKVVRRVLEEMAGRALREAVADVTASTAERLILEEITRIKSNIT